jgi:hypothetical protein
LAWEADQPTTMIDDDGVQAGSTWLQSRSFALALAERQALLRGVELGGCLQRAAYPQLAPDFFDLQVGMVAGRSAAADCGCGKEG